MKPPIFSYLLVKLASRCNFKCTYCYWFRDETVYKRPPILSEEAKGNLLEKLHKHIIQYKLKKFSILFHGGEPLLYNKKRFIILLDELKTIEDSTGCCFSLAITTNGALIDEEWVSIFRYYNIAVTISLDGEKETHDLSRVDLAGRGTYEKVTGAITKLRAYGIEPGILSVCNPSASAEGLLRHFFDELRFKHFDVLMPDFNNDDKPSSISTFYKELIDIWFDRYIEKGLQIRILNGFIKGLLGGESNMESIGYGPIQTVTINTNGDIEPLDVLRVAGSNAATTNLNLSQHTFQDVTKNPVWVNAWKSSIKLNSKCSRCEFSSACGGGFLPHRWSSSNGYDNPSVFCDDIQDILGYMWSRMSTKIFVTKNNETVTLSEAVKKIA